MTKAPAACLIGWPAAHSRSPLIHHYWLRTLGIEGGYVVEAVPPDDLRDFVLRLSLRGFVGANVTIPHKEGVLELSTPDARARAVGAANTLWFDGRRAALDQHRRRGLHRQSRCQRARLGRRSKRRWCWAPAAPRAPSCSGCSNAASSASISPTAPSPGPRCLQGSSGRRCILLPGTGIDDILPRAKLLVNTTSLGMHGQPSLDLDVARLPDGAVVADLVYVPLVTPLLAAAKARGLQDRRRARHAAASGGPRLRAVVRPAAAGHGRAACAGRGRSHKDLRE